MMNNCTVERGFMHCTEITIERGNRRLVYGHYYSAISVIACLQIAASVGHERRGLSHVVNMATRAGAEGNMAVK